MSKSPYRLIIPTVLLFSSLLTKPVFSQDDQSQLDQTLLGYLSSNSFGYSNGPLENRISTDELLEIVRDAGIKEIDQIRKYRWIKVREYYDDPQLIDPSALRADLNGVTRDLVRATDQYKKLTDRKLDKKIFGAAERLSKYNTEAFLTAGAIMVKEGKINEGIFLMSLGIESQRWLQDIYESVFFSNFLLDPDNFIEILKQTASYIESSGFETSEDYWQIIENLEGEKDQVQQMSAAIQALMTEEDVSETETGNLSFPSDFKLEGDWYTSGNLGMGGSEVKAVSFSDGKAIFYSIRGETDIPGMETDYSMKQDQDQILLEIHGEQIMYKATHMVRYLAQDRIQMGPVYINNPSKFITSQVLVRYDNYTGFVDYDRTKMTEIYGGSIDVSESDLLEIWSEILQPLQDGDKQKLVSRINFPLGGQLAGVTEEEFLYDRSLMEDPLIRTILGNMDHNYLVPVSLEGGTPAVILCIVANPNIEYYLSESFESYPGYEFLFRKIEGKWKLSIFQTSVLNTYEGFERAVEERWAHLIRESNEELAFDQIRRSILELFIQRNFKALVSHIDFPLEGSWGFYSGLSDNYRDWTQDDFLNFCDLRINKGLLDVLNEARIYPEQDFGSEILNYGLNADYYNMESDISRELYLSIGKGESGWKILKMNFNMFNYR